MESFLCENPVILQDAAKFGFKSWIIPCAILYLGWRGTKKAWSNEKKFHAKLIKKNFPGEHKLKFPWFGPVLSSFAFLCLSFFILQDRAIKLNALKNAEYRTYQGYVAEIYRVDKHRTGWTKSRINFKINGHAIDSDGRHYKLNRNNDRVTTRSAVAADWGNNCSGYTCGLSIGDKVRIKQVPVKTYFGGDTLSIEKCEMP